MSGIGTTAATLTVTPSEKKLRMAGANYFRQEVSVTMNGHAYASPENLILLGYKGKTLVCQASNFAGSASVANDVIDLNTTELARFMTSVRVNAVRTIELRLWIDTTVPELMAMGSWDIRGIDDYEAYDSASVTPLSGSTLIWGNLAMVGGKTYLKNSEDGLWYPIDLSGTGGTVHYGIDETGGITIES
jgi:hypothetical protein